MRRSALPFGSRASYCGAAIPMPPLSRWAFALALLYASAAATSASSASSPWAALAGEDIVLPDEFRLQDDGQWDNDVTPEDDIIDKIATFIEQARRLSNRQLSQPVNNREEETYEDPLSYDGDVQSFPPAATVGQGPGFTYQFPEMAPSSAFAVNPSDPRYYFSADPIKSSANSIDTREAASEGGMAEEEFQERPSPQRFPEAKPVKLVASPSGKIATHPPGHRHENLGQKPPINEAPKDHTHNTPSEQVKREKPTKDPVLGKYYVYVTGLIAGCAAAGVVCVVAAGIFWYRLQRNAKAAADVEYPAYGVTGPNQEASAAAAAAASVAPSPGTGGSTSPLSAGDRRLAQSAQMYHYQHQKQQIIAMESRATNERHGSVSEVDSEEENEEGDYTVYECPGLAPTGEMEVKNPLFHDDPTPATPSGGNRDQRDAGGKH